MDDAYSLQSKGKILAIAVLSILLTLSFLMIVPSDEADDQPTSGICSESGDDTLTWEITEAEGVVTLTIKGQGNMKDFQSESKVPWVGSKDNISKIDLSPNLTSIGSYAFKGFSKVTGTIEINEYITYIGKEALADNGYSFISVDEGNNNYASSSGALYNLSKSLLIQVPAGFNTTPFLTPATVTKIGANAFMGCSFTELDIASNVAALEEDSLANSTIRDVVFGKQFAATETDIKYCGMKFYVDGEKATLDQMKGYKFYGQGNEKQRSSNTPDTYKIQFINCQPIADIHEVKSFPIVLPTDVKYSDKTPDTLVFVGWLKKDGDVYTPVGLSYTGTSNIELKADWKARITFDSNGGTAVDPILGYPGNWVEKPADPTKENLTFEKWVDSSGNTIEWPVQFKNNITYTAVWKVQITFDPNGGTIPEGQGTRLIEQGSAIGELPTPSNPGYEFAGWFIDPYAEGATAITKDKTFDKTTKVYAKWSTNSYTITFVCDVNGYPPVIIKTQTVAGGSVIKAPTDTTFKLDGTTYFIENWNGYTEGMKATEDMVFKGTYIKAINIEKPIEGSASIYYSDADAVYVLNGSFKKMVDKAKQDPEFTYTIVFNKGEITFDSEFLKSIKAQDTKVAIYKLNTEDIPGKVLSKVGSNPEVFTVVFGNSSTLTKELTIKLNHELSKGQVEKRLRIFSITADGTTITDMKGIPSADGITFDAKNLDYFSVKYDTVSLLIEYINEGKTFDYYLIEYGAVVPVPQTTPTKDPTTMYNYVFIEWSGYIPGMNAFTNHTFTASYETELRMYTVKFIAEAQGDSVTIDTQKLGYGSKITAPTNKSVEVGGKTYEIISYENLTAETVVSGDMTFRAVLKEGTSTSWIYMVLGAAIILIIVEGLYMYNKKFRD